MDRYIGWGLLLWAILFQPVAQESLVQPERLFHRVYYRRQVKYGDKGVIRQLHFNKIGSTINFYGAVPTTLYALWFVESRAALIAPADGKSQYQF
jgi:hypothetical protein